MLPRTARTTARPTLRALAGLLLAAAVASVLPVGAATATVPTPRAPQFPPQIEDYPRYERESECDPTAKPGALDLAALIKATYGSTQRTNIPRSCTGTGTSGHHSGRAVDWMVNVRVPAEKQLGDAFVAWLLAPDQYGNTHAMARRLGISYLIWDSRKFYLWAPQNGWTEYSDCLRVRTSPADDNYCHRNHVHTSMLWAGANRTTSWWTGGAGLPMRPAVDEFGLATTGAATGLLARADEDGSVVEQPWEGSSLGDPSDLGGATYYSPAVVTTPSGAADVVVVGTNGALYTAARPAADQPWSAWRKVPGPSLRGRPAAAAWPDGSLHLFAIGTDGALWHVSRRADATWTGWRSLGGAIAPGAGVSAAAAPDTTLRVVVRGTDSQAWVKSFVPGRGWQAGWSGIGGIIVGDPSVAVDGASGTPVVVVRGTNDAAYSLDLAAGTPLTWRRLGGRLLGSPGVGAVAATGVQVLVTDAGGDRYRIARSGGTWSGWTRVG